MPKFVFIEYEISIYILLTQCITWWCMFFLLELIVIVDLCTNIQTYKYNNKNNNNHNNNYKNKELNHMFNVSYKRLLNHS